MTTSLPTYGAYENAAGSSSTQWYWCQDAYWSFWFRSAITTTTQHGFFLGVQGRLRDAVEVMLLKNCRSIVTS
uniref:Uncharacterized protein n=1 Tax=Hyaloperonospora arabidopsidis (strain Emoy2) TaxID=559515 RepID=M4B1T6_HYAAE